MAVIAVVIILVIPAIKNALAKRDLTRVMNNGRELYLAAFRMATDGAAKSDANLAWPGDYPANNLAEYCGKLIEKDYVKPADLQRILSAPGAECTVATDGLPVNDVDRQKRAEDLQGETRRSFEHDFCG